MAPEPMEVTDLLAQWRGGDARALDRLMPLVYGELRSLAGSYLRRERADHTLNPTALVHEAYLKLVDRTHPQWRGRGHFYAVAAKVMRRILVDHARSVKASKRGGDVAKISLERLGEVADQRAEGMLALDAALSSLEALDPRKAQVVELRFFAGLSIEETAEFLGVSKATVIADTRTARAWLHSELE
ncbi:MAG: sigma-70 family RNA polymerase sigma factor, partial [Acidobacteria bacterium]|nr:sigma-70 family RNA polymerase sigma factor [Acidobacteriota bacterium]